MGYIGANRRGAHSSDAGIGGYLGESGDTPVVGRVPVPTVGIGSHYHKIHHDSITLSFGEPCLRVLMVVRFHGSLGVSR